MAVTGSNEIAKEHDLKIASVAELIEYRKQHEDMIGLRPCFAN